MKSFFDIVKRAVSFKAVSFRASSVRAASLFVMVAIIFCMLPSSSSAAPVSRWYVKLQVAYIAENVFEYNNVILGAATDATDAFESSYAARAVKSRYLSAYINRSDWNMDTDFFSEDIKGVDLPKTWKFHVESRFSKDLTISWGDLANVPSSITLTLYDTVANTYTVMTSGGNYVYNNSSSTPREFNVIAGGAFDMVAPETSLVNTPSGYVGIEPLTVEFVGTDDVTPVNALEYSYSLDEGVTWSAYSTLSSVVLEGLLEGEYVLSVKARDETGNEDLTPVEAIFIVGNAPTSTHSSVPMAAEGKAVTPLDVNSGIGRRVTPEAPTGRSLILP